MNKLATLLVASLLLATPVMADSASFFAAARIAAAQHIVAGTQADIARKEAQIAGPPPITPAHITADKQMIKHDNAVIAKANAYTAAH